MNKLSGRIVNNIIGYRRVHEDGKLGDCEMCGKHTKLYDDLCHECRKN